MPSLVYAAPSAPALPQAIAAAFTAAWVATDPAQGRRIFVATLRQILGAEHSDRAIEAALTLFNLQPTAPAGFEREPAGTCFRLCPRCQTIQSARHQAPYRQRVKLEILRDADWLQRQFEAKRTAEAIAARLGCTAGSVLYWAEKHGLQTYRTESAEEFAAAVRRLHLSGEAPGTIARRLESTMSRVRKSLATQGLANGKGGHHYFTPDWWIERLERRHMTLYQATREAGIKPHAGMYYVNRFGLTHITQANRNKKGDRHGPRHPALRDSAQLAELLRVHRTYQAVATVVGVSPTCVSKAARDVLGVGLRHRQFVAHSAPSWWTERLEAGKTAWELAAEAGIAEKSITEKVRSIDRALLAKLYANNAAAERKKRQVVAA